ncbi:MAG: GTP-binding protein [Intestinimonas sp.]
MRRLAVGILAHVDAGKTTLSEALLYRTGCLRRLGRVDHGDAFLDTAPLERERGITIFSKQAVLPLGRRSSRYWTRRAMWTSPPRWSGPCGCWTAPSW